MQTKSANRLTSRDLITIAIFSVLLVAINFIGSMLLGMVPVTYPFLVAGIVIPIGIIWTYLRVKVPKNWAILVQCVLIALLLLLLGTGWWITLGFLLGGLAAELVSRMGGYKSYRLNTIGYILFGVILNIGAFSPILLMADYYSRYCLENGMDAAYIDTLMLFMSWPVLLLSTALTVVGAIFGAGLGRLMHRKHFMKAGIA